MKEDEWNMQLEKLSIPKQTVEKHSYSRRLGKCEVAGVMFKEAELPPLRSSRDSLARRLAQNRQSIKPATTATKAAAFQRAAYSSKVLPAPFQASPRICS